MSKQNKEPIDLSFLAWVAFWALLGFIAWLAYLRDIQP